MSKTVFGPKNVWLKKNLGPKQLWAEKIQCPKKIKEFWVKKFGKILGPERFGSKEVGSKK